ncbi:MAG: type II toxin-antitoxin system RelE/ParE family toxin [Sulfitobacter sp.]
MAYRLSSKATEDVLNLYLEGLQTFGETQTESYHAGLKKCLDLLDHSPRIARERSELSAPMRVHPFKAHVIIYQIEGSDILIVRVRHGREDWINSPT